MKNRNNKGFSSLNLVFIVLAILALLLFVVQKTVLVGLKTAVQTEHTQMAFFAAEGSMYETVRHLKDDENWPISFPDIKSYKIGKVDVKRTISKVGNQLQINIESNMKGFKRRLFASLELGEQRAPVDIILIIDRSGSMAWVDSQGNRPIDKAKEAAKVFVDEIETANIGDRIGLITFSGGVDSRVSLTDDYQLFRQKIDDINASGATNIAEPIYQANDEFEDNSQDDIQKAVVLLSDGVPQYSHRSCSGCLSDACLAQDSGYKPDNQGNCCTEDAAYQAEQLKDMPNSVLFSIHLSNYRRSACDNIDSTKTLGRLTLLRISSEEASQPLPPEGQNYTFYKETSSASELTDIYSEIGVFINTGGAFEYQEEIPE